MNGRKSIHLEKSILWITNKERRRRREIIAQIETPVLYTCYALLVLSFRNDGVANL